VITPHIGNLELYKTSGHYPYYQHSQYNPMQVDDDEYMLKPMNCPHHHRIYSNDLRSYRDLPVRLAEFGTVYRYEQSGELNGMSRVRGFTQDDAHIYCTHDQLKDCSVASRSAGRTAEREPGYSAAAPSSPSPARTGPAGSALRTWPFERVSVMSVSPGSRCIGREQHTPAA
jgi:hypothetical protein